jgi:DNA-directed RNA polymerase specialized sigma54-like protein
MEAQSKSDETMIGRLMTDIMEKQHNMENLHSDLQHSLHMIQEMQNAINQGQDEQNALRFRITQMEVNRQDIVVTKNGQRWHVNPQCQFLQGAGAIKACAGCT